MKATKAQRNTLEIVDKNRWMFMPAHDLKSVVDAKLVEPYLPKEDSPWYGFRLTPAGRKALEAK